MPCSAEIEPWYFADDAMNDVVDLAPSARGTPPCRRRPAARHCNGYCRRRDGRRRRGRAPGMRAIDRRFSIASRKPGPRDRHRNVVLDRAAFELLHIDEDFAQSARSSLRWSSEAAIAASSTMPCLRRRFEQFHQMSPRGRCSACEAIRAAHTKACGAGSGSRDAGRMFQHEVEADARHEFEGLESLPAMSCARDQKLQAPGRDRRGR